MGRSSRAETSAFQPVGAPGARILGVDPGTVACGWGIVETRGAAVAHLASGMIRPAGQRATRLAAIYKELAVLCERFVPAVLSLEQTFVGDNVQSALRLGEARGAVMVAASQAGLDVAEYSPAEIKLAVAGSGRASKTQMQAMVGRLLGLDAAMAADEADALGAAICHAYVGRFAAALSRSKGWGGGGAGRGAGRR